MLIWGLGLKAQQTEVSFTPDTTSFAIGNQINALLTVKAPRDSVVEWQVVADTIGKLEVVWKSKIDTLLSNNYNVFTQNYKLTSFDSGSYMLKPLRFKIGEEVYYTQPKMLNVTTVKVDTTKQKMYGIKGNIYVGYTFWEILPYILIALAVVVFIYMIYYFWRNQKPKKKKIYVPKIPPYDVAMKNLKELDKTELLKEGNIKEYYGRLTNILRKYIEDDHNVSAMEFTTDEIMDSIEGVDVLKDSKSRIKELLSQSDFVKFAKFKPEEGKHYYFRNLAENVIIESSEALTKQKLEIEKQQLELKKKKEVTNNNNTKDE